MHACETSDATFVFRGGQFDLSKRTHVAGILNVTPDSFSDGGTFLRPETALRHAERMIEEGADVIDVGGESTRPNSTPVNESEEKTRVVPVISELARRFDVIISVDTYKSSVAEAALDAGAHIINDVSALRFDPELACVASKYGAGLILMHMKGTPATMQNDPEYDDVMVEIADFLRKAMERARTAGVKFESMMVDPGIGFGKELSHNLTILKNLSQLKSMQRPIMVGPSRKAFIGQLLDLPVDQRLPGTLAAVVVSILSGASMVRVHDVREAREAAAIADAVAKA
ncbi:MAG: dihydropteroate synthase [Candidatus Eisenbacteria bacterium]|nr:dihydropteroate synthase [Candidatus Eisenbacteria bacterium]